MTPNKKDLSRLYYLCMPAAMLSAILLFSIFYSGVATAATIVKVGAYQNFPKIYQDERGKVSGFWPELIEHIAANEGWDIQYLAGTWSQSLERLADGQIDIMPDVALTESRKKLFLFSELPILVSWSRVYVAADNHAINSIVELNNKTIAILKGSVNYEGKDGIEDLTEQFALNIRFVELDNYEAVFDSVAQGVADAGVTNRNFGNKRASSFELKQTPIVFQPVSINFAFSKVSSNTPYIAERVKFWATSTCSKKW